MRKKLFVVILAALALSACASSQQNTRNQSLTIQQQQQKRMQCDQLRHQIHRSTVRAPQSHAGAFDMAAYREFKALGC